MILLGTQENSTVSSVFESVLLIIEVFTVDWNYILDRTPVKASIGPDSTMVNEKHRYNLQPYVYWSLCNK